MSLSNAVTGEDLATGRQLSTGERWMEGVSGAFSLVTTATGGLGQVKNAIRSTGKCGSLGKYFTNCCFTGDVEVLVYLEESIAVPVANGETISIEPTPEDDALKDVAATVSVAPVNLAIDERDMSLEYALAALSEPKSNALSITNLLLCVTVAGGAATCAAYAWDKRRVRERAFAEYGAEDAEPELNETSLLAIAREGCEPSENIDFFEDNFDLKVESKREGIKLENRLTEKRKRRGFPVATICSLALLILCVASIAVWGFIGSNRRTDIARVSLSRLTRVSVEQSFAEPVEEINSGESEEDEIFFDENLAEDEEEPSFRESRIEVPIAYRSKEVGPRRISEIQVGDRLPGENPQGNDGSSELEFLLKPHCVYSLRYEKEDGTFCNIKLLRPDDWLDTVESQIRRVSDGKVLDGIDLQLLNFSPIASLQAYDVEVWLDLEELGCVGWATVVDIDDSFEYREGVGNLVTGTFEHEVGEVVDLQLEDQEKLIGVTTTHPFWSADREDFVTVADLYEGERVLLYNGETKRVVQKLPRPGPQTVYNLEVFGEHVYCVTTDGALAHNNCPKKPGLYVGPYGTNAHRNEVKAAFEIASIEEVEFHHATQKALNELFGIAKNDGIAIMLPKRLHKKTWTYGFKGRRAFKELMNNPNITNKRRAALARDIWDLRKILKEDGYDWKEVNAILKDLIAQNKKLGGI